MYISQLRWPVIDIPFSLKAFVASITALGMRGSSFLEAAGSASDEDVAPRLPIALLLLLPPERPRGSTEHLIEASELSQYGNG